jgi:hypothetical protein
VKIANDNPHRKATVDQQTVGRTRRIRKAAARRERTRPMSDRAGEPQVTDATESMSDGETGADAVEVA